METFVVQPRAENQRPGTEAVPESLLSILENSLTQRQIARGINCLEENRVLLESFNADWCNAAAFVSHLAQWVDIGFAGPQLIKRLLAEFPKPARARLPLLEYVYLRMAEAFIAMVEEHHELAIQHFQAILAFEDEIPDKELIAIANFWTGRCYRRQGRYRDALGYVAKARDLALSLHHQRMAAVMQVLEAWITFQEGDANGAVKILGEAESALRESDDYVTRGNINSAYGRIARRHGDYHQALLRFAGAIEEYKKRDPHHRNLARSLVNIAFVKRLLSLEIRTKIDRKVARDRKAASNQAAGPATLKQGREQIRHLHEEAKADLVEAQKIYQGHNDHRGLGNVHITYGYLHLDDGNLDRAAQEGAAAHLLAEENKDHVLKARACILQSAVDCARADEQIEDGLITGEASRMAVEHARQAVQHARDTQNKRLIAKSQIALGLALALDLPGNWEAAQECYDLGSELLNLQSHDYVWRELQLLSSKLRGAGSVDARLREWSQGRVGNKSFQQVTEEFAAIVIPKIWNREDRKISRVAERLSISPKKVRKILRSQGLLKA